MVSVCVACCFWTAGFFLYYFSRRFKVIFYADLRGFFRLTQGAYCPLFLG